MCRHCIIYIALETQSKMVFKAEISAEKKAKVKVMNELTSLSVSEIARKCNVSRSSTYRVLKRKENKTKVKSGGRPRKISEKDERHIARTLLQLRRTDGTVSCSRVMSESGIDLSKISVWTARRVLNRLGYRYLLAQKKGLLSSKDLIHVGSGGRTVKFFVAISYGVGVVFCHQYEHLNGENFKKHNFESLQ